MPFREMLKAYEGLLEADVYIHLDNGNILRLPCERKSKCAMKVFGDFIEVKMYNHGKMVNRHHIPIRKICNFEVGDVKD